MDLLKNWAYKNLKGDPIIWLIIIILSLFSIVVVYSATGTLAYKMKGGNTEFYLVKHSILVAISLLATWIFHLIDYRYYAKVSRVLLWVSVPLLIVTWQFGVNINEASRWLTIPVLNLGFQPSDLAKLALLITLASMLGKRQNNIHNFQKAIIPMLIWIGLVCGLIAMTNISTGILLFVTCMLLLFLGRVSMKYIGLLMIIGVISGVSALIFGQRYDTVRARFEVYVQGETSYQAKHSNIAIASGGIFGKGPGKSDQRNYLPHPYSDFVYSIIVEEYGFIGGFAVLVIYMVLLYRTTMVVYKSDQPFGGLLSIGLCFALVIQGVVNTGVTVGLGPITGLPLPLISMGGTSQLFMGVALGMILSVSRKKDEVNYENLERQESDEDGEMDDELDSHGDDNADDDVDNDDDPDHESGDDDLTDAA